MTVPPAMTGRSIDQLENDMIGLFKRMTAHEYDFLVLLREFDLRQGWKAYHFNHCAEWLNFKCGICLNTGREKVRVAHALWDLPLLSAAFQSGELPYSKARALTRLATPASEAGLLDYAMGATAEQVENHCRALRNVQRRESTQDANRAHNRRYLSSCKHGDGMMTISLELTEEAGDLVMKTLERAMSEREKEDRSAEHAADTSAEASGPSKSATYFARRADALVEVCQAFLAGGSGKSTSTADHYQVVVHVDEKALAGEASAEASAPKSDLPIESVRRLCCDTSLVAVTKGENGNPLDVGRKHRIVQPALRRALLARDKCCSYPGCSHTRWLDAHHVQHWIDGGDTSLENTLLLCSKHHRLLHEGGFSIKKNYKGEQYFETAQGKVISKAPVYRLQEDQGCPGISERKAVYVVNTSAEAPTPDLLQIIIRPPECRLHFAM
jgi:hypothetical protein